MNFYEFITDTSNDTKKKKLLLLLGLSVVSIVYIASFWIASPIVWGVISVIIFLFVAYKLYKLKFFSFLKRAGNQSSNKNKPNSVFLFFYNMYLNLKIIYNKYPKIINITLFFLIIGSIIVSYKRDLLSISVLLSLFLLITAYKKYKNYKQYLRINSNNLDQNKTKSKFSLSDINLTTEQLNFNLLLFIIVCTIIYQKQYFTPGFFALYVCLSLIIYTIYLVNYKIFIGFVASILILLGLAIIFSNNLEQILFDVIFVFFLIIIIIKSKYIIRNVLKLNQGLFEGTVFNKKVTKYVILIRIVCLLFIFYFISAIKNELMTDNQKELLKYSNENVLDED